MRGLRGWNSKKKYRIVIFKTGRRPSFAFDVLADGLEGYCMPTCVDMRRTTLIPKIYEERRRW